MKKLKGVLIIIALFYLMYFLQTNFFSWFTIRGVMPNTFVVLVLFIGLFAGKKIGGICGLIFGIILDILVGESIGFTGIFLAIIGLLGEYFDKNFSKDSRVTIILMVTGATIVFEICNYIVRILGSHVEIEILPFILILLTEVIYNVFLVIIFYPCIKKLGYYIENLFKNKKILTRYF